jgi:tRNA threonylcarbamoyl adenosine modification protein YeaZ
MTAALPVRLVLDTSGPRGFAALAVGDSQVQVRWIADRNRQGAELIPHIAALLEEGGVTVKDLQEILVGEGPGSFTGIRIAAATARGLAHPYETPVVPISSLAAGAALEPFPPGTPRIVLFDARGDRVYAGGWIRRDSGSGEGVLETVLPPQPQTIGELLALPFAPGVEFSGDGALRHRARIEELGFTVMEPPVGFPHPEGFLRVRREDPGVQPVAQPGEQPGERGAAARGWEPAYLCPSQPEREAQARGD